MLGMAGINRLYEVGDTAQGASKDSWCLLIILKESEQDR
jgi:hypothetical protein